MKKFPQNSILNTINYPHSILDLDPNKLHNDNLIKLQALIVYTVSVDVKQHQTGTPQNISYICNRQLRL